MALLYNAFLCVSHTYPSSVEGRGLGLFRSSSVQLLTGSTVREFWRLVEVLWAGVLGDFGGWWRFCAVCSDSFLICYSLSWWMVDGANWFLMAGTPQGSVWARSCSSCASRSFSPNFLHHGALLSHSRGRILETILATSFLHFMRFYQDVCSGKVWVYLFK